MAQPGLDQPSLPTAWPSSSSSLVLPCGGMHTADRRRQIAREIASISGATVFGSTRSPEWSAFSWLTESDKRYLCPDDSSLHQRYILAVLYFITDGENWIKCRRDGLAQCAGQNFLGEHSECQWGGITCNESGQVTRINLDEANLKGSLPIELSYLEHLEEIDFDSNAIGGNIPSWLDRLRFLERLDLDSNKFSGTIPESIYASTSLKFFDVDRNNISGTLSTQIGTMQQLIFFQVDYNQMSGTLPSQLSLLSKLHYFSVFGNNFDETVGIPETMCGNHIQIYANCNVCPGDLECCTMCFPET